MYSIRNVIGHLDKNMYTEKHLIELFNDHNYR